MSSLRSRDYMDFLIVGAGPAGLLAAINLTWLGFKVEIIDRIKEQVRPICGEYLSPEGKVQLTAMGLSQVLEGFQAVKGMILYSPSGIRVETDFPEGETGVSLNREVFQKRLEDLFLKIGGRIHYGSALSNVTIVGDLVKTEVHGKCFISRYILGADGRSSSVARLLGMKTEASENKRMALHVYLRPKIPLPHYGQMHILPGGQYIGINPINDHEANFSLVTDQEMVKSMGGTKEILNYWIKNRDSLVRQIPEITSESIKTTSPVGRHSLDIVNLKAALIGDASGFIDPLTGEGITTAIKTARILSQELNKSSTIEEGFRQYAQRRKMDFSEKEKMNYRFQKLIKSPLATDTLAMGLLASKKVRDTFIGIVGNVYTPNEALKKVVSEFLMGRS